MLGVRDGDENAFVELYDRYSSRMARYFAVRLGSDQMLVEDFIQDLFIKIIEKPHLFDPDRRFSTWIFSMAMNMCKNEYKRRTFRKTEILLPDTQEMAAQLLSDFDVEKNLDGKTLAAQVSRRLDKMDAAKKDTFIFRFQQQLSLEEISEIMACSVGTVKSRLFYTLRALAGQLKEYNPNMRS